MNLIPLLSPDDPGQAIGPLVGDVFPRRAAERARFTPAAFVPPRRGSDTDFPMVLNHRPPARALATRAR